MLQHTRPIKLKNNQWNLLRFKGADEDKVFVGPQIVEIHLTNACALSCLFCPYHFCGDEKYTEARRDIDFGVFQSIINDCAALKVDRIIFTGEGDPFSHPEICRMISYVKDKNLILDVDTHALFPGKKMFPYAQRVDCLNINLPGVDEESYQRSQFDRKNCFERVAANVQLLAQYKKELRPKLNWIYVVTKDSLAHLSQALLLAEELGFDTVSFRLVNVHEDNDQMAVTGEYLQDLKKEITAALKIDAGNKVKSNILRLANQVTSMISYDECKRDAPHNSRFKQRRSIYFEKIFPKDFSCHVGWHKAFVDLNGDFLLCCGNLQTVVGNVYRDKFQDIWNSQRAAQMRFEMKYHFDLDQEFFRECRTCPFMIVSAKGEATGQMEWSKKA